MNSTLREELKKCPDCNGDGYTAEHAGDGRCNHDDHSGCPVQVQCGRCHANGYFVSIDQLEALIQRKQVEAKESEQGRVLAELRHLGYNHNAKLMWQLRKEWERTVEPKKDSKELS